MAMTGMSGADDCRCVSASSPRASGSVRLTSATVNSARSSRRIAWPISVTWTMLCSSRSASPSMIDNSFASPGLSSTSSTRTEPSLRTRRQCISAARCSAAVSSSTSQGLSTTPAKLAWGAVSGRNASSL